MIIVLMGVAGSGKTTIGLMLSKRLGWPFLEGDDFHPAVNIEKMSRGIPLTDEDRLPWLLRIAEEIEGFETQNVSAIVGCSALKASYRDVLRRNGRDVRFVYLKGPFDLIYARLALRKGHFMKPEMLKSQFETLEETEDLIAIDANQPPDAMISEIVNLLGL